ncbi:glycosyltransferase [bacterium]|nr:glycosyltransferase [bacterium]
MKRIFIFSSISWNSFWQHPQTIAEILSEKHKVFFINPLKVQDFSISHLQELFSFSHSSNLKIVKSSFSLTTLSLGYFFLQELVNWRKAWIISSRDLVIFYYPIGQLLAFLWTRLKGTPSVFMYVDEYGEFSKSKWKSILVRWLTTFFLKRADKVLCTSRLLFRQARKLNQGAFYLPNGIDLRKVKKEFSTAKDRFVPLCPDKKKTIIGYVGSLLPRLRIEDFFILARLPSVELHLVGDGPERKRIEATIKKEKFANIKLYGPLPHNEAMKVLDHFDICLLPFCLNKLTNRVSSIKLFEYATFKKPVLATPTFEIKQYKTAFCFYRNSRELLSLAKRLIDDLKWRQELGDRGFAIVKNHDWSGKLKRKLLQELGLKK